MNREARPRKQYVTFFSETTRANERDPMARCATTTTASVSALRIRRWEFKRLGRRRKRTAVGDSDTQPASTSPLSRGSDPTRAGRWT